MVTKRALSTTVLLLLISLTVLAQERVHVLQRGETIYTLARRYQVSADALLEYNSIADPTRLAVGTEIRIPGTYVVQDGEYVFSIAGKLGVNWLDLLAANGLDRDDVVRPGDVLIVPGFSDERPVRTASEQGSRDEDTNSGTYRETDAARGTDEAGANDPAPVEAGSRETGVSNRAVAWPHPGVREAWDGKFPGVVMRGTIGDEFTSVTAGVVEYVGPFSSFGKLILVRSANGYLYGYAGADEVLVQAGDRVDRGASLGTVGFSPAFDSAMVLFTVWRNNRYVDPETAPRG